MSRTSKATKSNVKRASRPAVSKRRRIANATKKATLTVGDLIAAAFDAVGTEVRDVARVLSSQEVCRRTGRRLVFV